MVYEVYIPLGRERVRWLGNLGLYAFSLALALGLSRFRVLGFWCCVGLLPWSFDLDLGCRLGALTFDD